jgi:hypothetical protein
VTIDRVQAHKGEEGADDGEWIDVASNPGTYNLLELVNGVMQQLGITELETGYYSQMRLYIGNSPYEGTNILLNPHPFANYVIDKSVPPNELPLFVPSGYETGIKLVKGFTIEAGVTKELVLDFDVSRSIVTAGRSGTIILKPTIKVIDVTNSPILTGVVTDAEGAPVPGAYVSAQVYNASAVDAKDQITIAAGTPANDDGEYRLRMEPGTFNVVAYKEGKTGAHVNLNFQNGTTYVQVISLSDNPIAITAQASIAGDAEAQTATVSFRQYAEADDLTTLIEIISINLEGGAEPVDVYLPVKAPTSL